MLTIQPAGQSFRVDNVQWLLKFQGLLESDENLHLYSLLELSESDIKALLLKYGGSNEDARRLNLALRNLKIATGV